MQHSLIIRFYTIPEIAKAELNAFQFKVYQTKTGIILNKLRKNFPDAVTIKDGFEVVSDPDKFEIVKKEVERMKAAIFDNKIDKNTKKILHDSFFAKLKNNFARISLKVYKKLNREGSMIQYLSQCGIMFFWEIKSISTNEITKSA